MSEPQAKRAKIGAWSPTFFVAFFLVACNVFKCIVSKGSEGGVIRHDTATATAKPSAHTTCPHHVPTPRAHTTCPHHVHHVPTPRVQLRRRLLLIVGCLCTVGAFLVAPQTPRMQASQARAVPVARACTWPPITGSVLVRVQCSCPRW